MFIYDSYNTVMFAEIESFRASANHRGGDWGNVFVITKTGRSIMFHYDEREYDSPELAEWEVCEKIRKAIEQNKRIAF